jgi:hypothetical protein
MMPTTLSKSLPFCFLEIKSKTENFPCSELKHLFTFYFHPPIRQFRRTEPKRRWGLYNHQNWAYVTKRRHCCMNHSVAICTRNCLEIKRKTENVFFAPSWNTYSPIHLFTFSPHCLEIKRKTENILLLRVKTTIHLFTYSPIHLFLSSSHSSIFRRTEPKTALTSSHLPELGVCN